MIQRKYKYKGVIFSKGQNFVWYFCQKKNTKHFSLVIEEKENSGDKSTLKKIATYDEIHVKLLPHQCREFALNVVREKHLKTKTSKTK